MHFEILVEDRSGKQALKTLVPKILGSDHECRIIAFKGIGRIPKGLGSKSDPAKRKLLNELPRLLRVYGKKYSSSACAAAVIVVCDLDNRCLSEFLKELHSVLNKCDPKPETRFCIAIEEGEAWFLGDIPAIKAAYPKAKDSVLNKYKNDSICGTWELLADAIFNGGAKALRRKRMDGWEKSKWAKNIPPHMDVAKNLSPSFNHFRRNLLELAGADV